MAEVLLGDRLRALSFEAQVESAGIAALTGHKVDPAVLDLLGLRGLSLKQHRARQLTPELIRSFELILVMEAGQQRAVEAIDSSARGRVHRLGRFGDFDVPDPYRRGRGAFEQALALIEQGIGDFEKAFWSKRR